MASKNFRVQTTHETYYTLYNAITTARPFIYSRYGDGDLNVMVAGARDAQQMYSEALAEELRDTFLDESPNNLVGLCMHELEEGMQPGLFEGWDHPVFVDWINTVAPDRVFYNAIALHYYCVFRTFEMRHLLFQIKKVPNKTFIGNTSRELVEAVLGPIDHYVPTEVVNAYDQIDQWWPEIDAITQEPGLIIAAMGLSTRAMNRRLLLKNWFGQSLDLGSTIDYLVGHDNRTWHSMAGAEARSLVLRNV